MRKGETEYQKLLVERFGELANDWDNKTTFKALYNDPGEEGYEAEMLEFLKSHPDSTFQELVQYDFSFYGDEPLEIVDDDEMDEEKE